MAYDQRSRTFRLKCTDGYPGASAPVFRRMTAFERLSTPYEYRVLALLERPSEAPHFELNKVLGKGFSVGIYDEGVSVRFFHGYCSEARFVGTERGGYLVELLLRPALWFATRGSNCRVFHDKGADEIISEVLHANPQPKIKVTMRIGDLPKKRVYCVQYQETDFNFVSRLMEEEGIFYYFSHSEGGHELIITDDGKGEDRGHDNVGEVLFRAPENAQHRQQRHLSEWLIRASVEQADGNHLIGYNYEKREVFGATKLTPPPETISVTQNEHFPTAKSKGDDEYYARRWSDAEVALRITRQASGNEVRLGPGDNFELTDHPLSDENRKYSVVETHHLLESDAYHSGDYAVPTERIDLVAIPSDVTFRPKRLTPRPRIAGPQTAIVAADDAGASEEIVTDSLGRVRVNFFWGNSTWRDGINHGKMSDTSCWIRVAQIWAGKQWGALFIPRVGQEVVVEFEEGDPDRPLITGSVYNGQYPVPYSLPGHKTRSTIKSESSKGGGGFNEMRFEDKKGSEEYYMHAQKDMNVEILNNLSTTVGSNEKRSVGFDRTTEIGKNDKITIGMNLDETVGMNQTTMIGAQLSTTVGATESRTVGVSRTTTIGATETTTIGAASSTTIGGARTDTVGGADALTVAGMKADTVGGVYSLTVGGALSITAGGAIMLNSGGPIVMSSGSAVVINAGAAVVVNSGGVTISIANGHLSRPAWIPLP